MVAVLIVALVVGIAESAWLAWVFVELAQHGSIIVSEPNFKIAVGEAVLCTVLAVVFVVLIVWIVRKVRGE